MLESCFHHDTYVDGLVELQVEVHLRNAVHVGLVNVEVAAFKVLCHDSRTRGLGNDSKATLGCPSKEDLCGSLVVLLSEALEDFMFHERRGRRGNIHIELDEACRTERGVRSHSNALGLGQTYEFVLLEVGVKFNLEGSRPDLGILEHIIDSLRLEVRNSNTPRKTLLDELLHGTPGLLVSGLAPANLLLAVVVPARRVAHAGVDVLEGDGEVDEEEVKVVDLPVGELAAGDGSDVFLVVEGLPELGDDEEVFTLHEAFGDGPGDAFSAFLFVSIICMRRQTLDISFECSKIFFGAA